MSPIPPPSQLSDPALGAYGGVVRAGVAFLVAFVVVYLLGRFLAVPAVRRALAERGYQAALVGVATQVARLAVLAVAISVAFTVAGYGEVLSAVAILGGVLALAVGFAAQDLIANVVAGVFIIRDEPFVVDDWIRWDGGEGVVDEVGLRVTRLKTFDNELVTVPNAELSNTAVTNPVATGTLRLREPFGIGYDEDVERASEILIEEARAHADVLNEPEPDVALVDLGDSAVGLESRFWIRDPTAGAAGRVRSEYVQAVKARFDEAGVELPYPHTELTGGVEVTESLAEGGAEHVD